MSKSSSNPTDRVGAANDDLAPACISAISGRYSNSRGLRPGFLGESLFIHKNYVDLRPVYPDTNVCKKDFRGFKVKNARTRSEIHRKHELHYNYRKNEYGFKTNIDDYKVIKEKDGTFRQVNPVPQKTKLEKAQLAAQHASESKLYIKNNTNRSYMREKRGIITNVSKKSANRLKKFLASILDLGLWIDFTFPDDVMVGKTLEERRDFANECLKKLKRFIHRQKLKEIWKKEFTTRKSGRLKGLYLPHYHIALAGLSRKQEKDWQLTCIMILKKWVDIMGSDDDNALIVACNRNSFRKIHCSRQAISYIGKYFSKTNEVEDENGEIISIGRAWGYAKVLKDEIPDPHHLFLNKRQSIQFRRFVKKYKQLKRNKKGFIGIREQITNGSSTFLFANEDVLLRFLMSIDVDILQKDGIPF